MILKNLEINSLTQILKYTDSIRQKNCEIDYFIEQCSNEVCPDCKQVCCINRHGIDGYHDIIFKLITGIVPITADLMINYDAPCQYLSEKGCILKRYDRPYRCTWFFCSETLRYFESGNQRKYRDMTTKIAEIGQLRIVVEEQLILSVVKS
ncbi:MAG: hypothetical protein HQK91_07450 [Nitrospirae bacterium]|nr:hypothetical protein [Nitrospirota bacterium]